MSSALQNYIRLHKFEQAMSSGEAPECPLNGGDLIEVEGMSGPRSERLRRKLGAQTASIMDFVNVTRKINKTAHVASQRTEGLEDIKGACRRCHVSNTFILHTRTATQTCSNCGETVPYQDKDAQFMDAMWRDNTTMKPQSFSYKRSNHMLSWILRIQGKENSSVSPAELDLIRKEFDKMQLDCTDYAVVSIDRLRAVLKAVRLPKHYSHIHSIRHTLTGYAPPQMTGEQEIAVMAMFKDVAKLYDIVQARGQTSRSNMLSYSIVLSKILESLGFDNFLDSLRLLKHRERLVEQERIWKQICTESALHEDLPTFVFTQSPVF